MWPFTNLFSKNKGESRSAKMKKIIIYTVTTEVLGNDAGDCNRKIRQIRKDLKTVINSHDGNRIMKIESKEE